MFSWLLSRVQSKLEGWKEKLISKGGKEVLLKAVIQSIPQYAMSVFKIPISLCKVIEKCMAKFWWNNDKSRSGVHWQSWKHLQNRKDNGGLGFRNLVSFNHAMLGKQAWRLLHQPSSLWCKLFKGLYFPSSSFLQAYRGSRPSWGWQSLLCGRNSIDSHVSWSVGDGKSIKIREDRWLPMGVLVGPKAPEEPTLVADLIDPATSSWRVDLLSRFFDMPIIQQITSIQLRPNFTTDELIWTATKNGTFTVKSAYHALTQSQSDISTLNASSSHQIPTWLWRSIWKMPAAPKIRAFLWSLCNNALATRENLHRRHILDTPCCTLCKKKIPETSEHLLLLCSWTQRVWKHPRIRISIDPINIHRIDSWITSTIESGDRLPQLAIISHILWQIWRARNAFVFRGSNPNPDQVVDTALTGAQADRLSSPSNLHQNGSVTYGSHLWRPPDPGVLKVNVDGSYHQGSNNGTIACICRNRQGRLTDGFSLGVVAASALQVEIQALSFSLRRLLHQGLQNAKIVVESDNFSLVDILNNRSQPPCRIAPCSLKPLSS